MQEHQLTGIILSGGKSSRMGLEKGLADYRGKPLIFYAIQALQPVTENLLIGANNSLDEYGKFGHEIVQDKIKNIGPAGGLLATLKHSKTDKNLVLSCDMPFVSSDLLDYLFQNIQDYEVLVPLHGKNRFEPLCGFYNKSIIPVLEKNIREGNYKLMDIFHQVRFKAIHIGPSLPFYNNHLFFNVNRPEDLNA